MLDIGNSTTATVPNLTAGTTYFFAVTAYDIDGVESVASAEVSFINAPNDSSATPPGSISSLQRLYTGSIQLTLTVGPPAPSVVSTSPGVANPSAGVDIQFTNDLVTWSVLTTIPNTSGTITVTDPSAARVPRRFYRLVFH